MRTPLTALKASLALLEEERGCAQTTRELLGICRRNTDYLLKLVNDLLELSRIEHTAPTALEPVALAEVTRETVESFAPLAAQQRVLVTAWVPSHLAVPAEPEGLRRILLNLIGNALKFAPGGHVDVSAEQVDRTVYLRVCDNGPGIARDRLEVLFNRYGTSRESAAQQGTGLGLAITKALVTRYRGHITVQSEVNRGTCFIVALPAYEPDADLPAPIQRRDTHPERYAARMAGG
jgi:signal transduction histidine kinase